VDVAAAGGDAFRELGDDANGVLRGVEGGGQSVVGIKRSRHAENKQAEREREGGRGTQRTGHWKRWMPRRLPAGTVAESGRRANDSIALDG